MTAGGIVKAMVSIAATRVDRAPAQRRSHMQWALMLPLVLYLVAFYAYPVLAMMFRSVSEPSWTIANFARIFQEAVYLHVLWLTFRVALVVTVLALILGFPVAYLLARIERSRSNLLMILVLLPFWTSILVRTYAWMVLLGRQGIVNQFLQWVGAIEQPLQLLNTTFAVYVAMVHILLPFMIVTVPVGCAL